ncbi:hypothetical protein B0H11DRAFT_2234452 [Mycena galericulata]|nr:hypothetical protein B0H11DRAFT_2234452 [Mycena galericulata]
MAPVVQSEDSDSDSDSSSAESRPTPKTIPRLDLAAPTPKSTRPRQSSSKVKEIEKRADIAKDAQIAALKQQVKNLGKKNEKNKEVLRERDVQRTPPESEEEDDNEVVEMSSYSNSFVSKGIVGQTAQKPVPKKLRKSGEAPVATPMSRRPLTEMDKNVPSDDHLTAAAAWENEKAGAALTSPPSSPLKRKRVHGSSPPPIRSSATSKSKRRKRAKVVEEPLPKAEFVSGKAPGGSRTNLKDYTEPARKLLKRAMHAYEYDVCVEAGERMELTERMANMINKYGSHARSALKDGVRPLVAPTYKFKIGDSKEIVRKNIKIWEASINESAFHYKDPATLTGYAGNTIIMDSIRTIFFKTKAGRGIVYSTYFSPISLIEFCIEEYSTGRFQQGFFDEVANKERYNVHLQDLTEWAALKPSVTDVIFQRMHDQCRALTGVAPVKAMGRLTETNRARALEELEAMEVDSDAEQAEDELGEKSDEHLGEKLVEQDAVPES